MMKHDIHFVTLETTPYAECGETPYAETTTDPSRVTCLDCLGRMFPDEPDEILPDTRSNISVDYTR